MKQNILVSLLLALGVTAFAGCGKKTPEKAAAQEIDFGSFKDSVYRNDYFGLTMTLPPEWSVLDSEEHHRLSESGHELLAGDDKNLKAVLKASELTTVNLWGAFRHPVGSAVEFNPSILCVAERVGHLRGIKTGKDYLFHAKKFMKAGKMEFQFPTETSTESIAGRDFGVMPVEMIALDVTTTQLYYACIMKGYALVVILSYSTDEERQSLQDILNSMVLK